MWAVLALARTDRVAPTRVDLLDESCLALLAHGEVHGRQRERSAQTIGPARPPCLTGTRSRRWRPAPLPALAHALSAVRGR